jgi:hypothetical protein
MLCRASFPYQPTPIPWKESIFESFGQRCRSLTSVPNYISTTGLSYSCPSPSSSHLLHLPENSFVTHHFYNRPVTTISAMAMLLSILALIVAASAAPVVIPVSQSAVAATRQLEELDRTSMIENEFSSLLNECKDVVFVWARGTAEAGNMVRTSRNKIRGDGLCGPIFYKPSARRHRHVCCGRDA